MRYNSSLSVGQPSLSSQTCFLALRTRLQHHQTETGTAKVPGTNDNWEMLYAQRLVFTSRCCLWGRDLGGGEGEPPEALNEDRAEQRNTHIGMPAGRPDKWMCGEHGDETSHQLLPFQGCWGSVDELTKSVALKNTTQALISTFNFLGFRRAPCRFILLCLHP